MRFASKIGLSVTAAALIIGPLLGTAVFLEARSLLLERIIHEQVQIAAGVMEKIDHSMFMAYEDMDLIAADEFLRGFLESPSMNGGRADMVANELEERAKLTGPWDGMSVFDRTGRVVFAPMGVGSIGALADSPLTRVAFESALKGKRYYSDRIVCRRTGRPVVIFAAPIFGRDDANKVVGVLISHYVWASTQNILDTVEAPATVHMLNLKGEVIGQRSDDHLEMKAMPLPSTNPAWKALPGGGGYAILPSSIHGGGTSLVVDVPQKGMGGYRGIGWTLMLEMPLKVIFTPIVALARDTGLLVVGMLLAVAALFAILGRRFIRPLGELVKGVRQVQQGRFDQKVVVRSKDEFGELADSFNAMVDKLRVAQDELVRREKLAVLGQVASSVGHELRNPLGVMSNAVYFLQTVLSDADETTREYLNIIKNEIAVSERMASDLMDAVRTKPPNPEAVSVAELIEQALRKYTIPSSITVKLDIPATLPPLRVDAMQIHQVFGNLISNGVEAMMPEGGTLEIRAVENKPDGTITVSVRDSGNGIAPEVMGKLFQPLFTTKARGIGLGLVVVKNLTQANGGTVEVQSEQGKGTLFSITLPSYVPAVETA